MYLRKEKGVESGRGGRSVPWRTVDGCRPAVLGGEKFREWLVVKGHSRVRTRGWGWMGRGGNWWRIGSRRIPLLMKVDQKRKI